MKYLIMKNTGWQWPSLSRLACVPAAMLFFVLSVQAQPTITAASNPVVVPNGQASGTTTITWKAAPDYTYSEIYLSVDDAAWSDFAKGGDGSKSATLKLGSSYTFRMMIYEGQQGTPKVITKLTVTTKRGDILAPPSAGGGYEVDAVKDRGSDYRLAPIRNVRVDPGPRHIFIRFHGPPNRTPYVAIGRGAPIKGNDGEWVFGDNLVGGGFVGPGTVSDAEKAKGEYMFASAFGTTFSEEGLEPGRAYYYIITVPAGSGRSDQDTGRFVMRQLATTVKVVWEVVEVVDDSDDLSTAEIDFWFWANYGQPSGKFSQYYNGNADSGHAYNINRTAVVNNAPNTLTLAASGRDSDSTFTEAVDETIRPLDGPSNDRNDENVAKDAFDLTKYGDNATVNFKLNSLPGGSLKFTIFGHFEITRTTATAGASGNSENIGTTSSALTTGPAPVKPAARVKTEAGRVFSTPISICESARRARERNNPAAPGLEEICRNVKKGEALANADPLALELLNQQPDSARLGFDLGMAVAEGNTLPGPGKDKACAAQGTPEQQGGCRIAVLFSVERNRNGKLAATGAAIAAADAAVAEARNAQTDVFYRLGFDIATGIFGDPARGARGNTATGPGSLGTRDSLSAAGQRGFNASVALHLSRKYTP